MNNKLLRDIRKELKNKGYQVKKSRTNTHIGTIPINYTTEYFIKGNMIFEIERDLNDDTIRTWLHYYGINGKEDMAIKLTDVLNLA